VNTPTILAGVIADVLPNARYRCEDADGRSLVCHVGGDMRLKVVRVLPGDAVTIEVSPLDPSKGRIVGKCETRREQS
jgi:translation initiation factor IF-1